MHVSLEAQFATDMLFATVRLSGLMLLSPLFSIAQVPSKIKAMWLLATAFILISGVGLKGEAMPMSAFELGLAVFQEMLIGALLAFGLFTAFGAFLVGGRLLDFQMGFGVASLIDPATRSQNPLLGTLLSLLAVAVFFAINGHHMMIRGLAYSLNHLPPGSGLIDFEIADLVKQFGYMFSFGIALVAPAVITLLLIDAGMAVAARTMPQVNMFIVGFPIKIFIGLLMLALSINFLTPIMERIFSSIFLFWERVIG
ncbi:MAG: flagellar biosynthetic protein FliR [Candidatus Thiodiazotropha sp. (ex Dulcina madagascariensis)]|nr:flagellar biosynthetic protein FliR [Candidatus Thiodiazotropha sp. (ex Dulcina madagascariensis)]